MGTPVILAISIIPFFTLCLGPLGPSIVSAPLFPFLMASINSNVALAPFLLCDPLTTFKPIAEPACAMISPSAEFEIITVVFSLSLRAYNPHWCACQSAKIH